MDRVISWTLWDWMFAFQVGAWTAMLTAAVMHHHYGVHRVSPTVSGYKAGYGEVGEDTVGDGVGSISLSHPAPSVFKELEDLEGEDGNE